ncbi:hypothetical protein D3C86_1496340 [compost metagenome]
MIAEGLAGSAKPVKACRSGVPCASTGKPSSSASRARAPIALKVRLAVPGAMGSTQRSSLERPLRATERRSGTACVTFRFAAVNETRTSWSCGV